MQTTRSSPARTRHRFPLALALSLGIALLAGLGGCATPKGATPVEQRAAVLSMHDSVVHELATQRPGFEARLRQAPGYAVFSNLSTKILFLGSGNGYGVVVNNQSRDKTYMRMAEIGAGIGLGIKDWRTVFVFNNPRAMYLFLQDGWDLGGDADAAFKIGSGGGQAGDGFIANDVDVYQFTDQGVTLSAMLNGMRFWQDPKLNTGPTTTTTVAEAETAK